LYIYIEFESCNSLPARVTLTFFINVCPIKLIGATLSAATILTHALAASRFYILASTRRKVFERSRKLFEECIRNLYGGSTIGLRGSTSRHEEEATDVFVGGIVKKSIAEVIELGLS